MQKMSYLCRLDPVDDALNVLAVRVQRREADVVQSSVMLLQATGGSVRQDDRLHWDTSSRQAAVGSSYLLHVLHLALQGAVVRRISTVEALGAETVSVIPARQTTTRGEGWREEVCIIKLELCALKAVLKPLML